MRRPVTSTRRMRSIRPDPPTNAEAAQLVIVDELDSGVFECRLNFDQS